MGDGPGTRPRATRGDQARADRVKREGYRVDPLGAEACVSRGGLLERRGRIDTIASRFFIDLYPSLTAGIAANLRPSWPRDINPGRGCSSRLLSGAFLGHPAPLGWTG